MNLNITFSQVIKRLRDRGSFIILALLLLNITSCKTSRYASDVDMQAIVKASNKLGFDIERKDNQHLMIEAAKWIGVPYQYGGTNFRGVDCSGLTRNIYKNVYGIKLERSSRTIFHENVNVKVSKSKLEQGDLVFFSPNGSKKKVNHVGVYLKDNKFIHASTSKGVRIDNLNDSHWKRQWVTGGRVRQ